MAHLWVVILIANFVGGVAKQGVGLGHGSGARIFEFRGFEERLRQMAVELFEYEEDEVDDHYLSTWGEKVQR
jgi:hypothetical protein